MNRLVFATCLLLLCACEAGEPFEPDGLRCETSLDCPRSLCSMGTCRDGSCTWSGIGCFNDGGPSCAVNEDCPLDACGRPTFCVASTCGELQRPCDAGAP